MRLFLAIDLPSAVKSQISAQIEELKKEYPVFNWVKESSYHMTLHFFGETHKYDEIIEKTKEILWDQDTFHLWGDRLDLFKNQHVTIYLSFLREKKLEQLIDTLRNQYSLFGFNEVKRFIPHITIARCKIPSKQQYLHLQKKLHKMEVGIDFPTASVTLFQSILVGRIPEYKEIKRFDFGESR